MDGTVSARPAHLAPSETFRAARDLLLHHRTDYDTAVRAFRWPAFDRFNWALDWFDVIARQRPAGAGDCGGGWPRNATIRSARLR